MPADLPPGATIFDFMPIEGLSLTQYRNTTTITERSTMGTTAYLWNMTSDTSGARRFLCLVDNVLFIGNAAEEGQEMRFNVLTWTNSTFASRESVRRTEDLERRGYQLDKHPLVYEVSDTWPDLLRKQARTPDHESLTRFADFALKAGTPVQPI
jgi:hypothetical protein